MTKLLKSDLIRRFAGGFLAGAIGIIVIQPPEGVLELMQTFIA